jgi:hypothetical protein
MGGIVGVKHALLIIGISFALFFNNYDYSFALSPSFSRQYIGEPQSNVWQPYALTNLANCSTTENVKFPHMEAISYISDGRFLNSTIWLNGPFNETIRSDNNSYFQMGGYFMLIKVISTYQSEGFDYMLTVESEPGAHWKRTLEEMSSYDRRSLEPLDSNYTGFFDNSPGNPSLREKGKGHVNLSIDLEKINFPEKYIVLFGTYYGRADRLHGGCMYWDLADAVAYAPPPEFPVSTSPNPVIMRADEQRNITLSVNSSISGPSLLNASLSLIPFPPKGLELSVVPNKQPMNLPGVTTSYVTVKSQTNPTFDQSYVARVMAEISFPKIPLNLTGIRANPLPAPVGNTAAQETIVTPTIDQTYYFKVDVKPALRFDERFANFWTNFWNVWGPLITLIGGGFATGLSALLINRFRGRSRNKSRRIDDYLE